METHAYRKLISEVTKIVGKKEVTEYMKQNYASVIDSRRTLHSIKTIAQLISILELRDEINEYDVSVLKNILEFLSNSESGDGAVKSSYELVIHYNKLHKPENPDGLCTVCAAPTQVKKLTWNNPVPVEIKPTAPHGESDSLDDVRKAVREIEDDISGSEWARIGRHLGVKEGFINNLNMQVPIKGISEVVHEMFDKWIKEKGDEATVKVLVDTLNHKHVARKDLALKLQKKYKRSL